MLNLINGLGDDNITPKPFTSLKPATTFAGSPADNFVASLQPSNFDLRLDVISIPIASDPATVPPEFRGVWRALHYCSDQIPYKKFVANNRTLVSLGAGVCIDWDSSFIV